MDQEYRGQRLAGLAHEAVFLQITEGQAEVPTAAQAEVLAGCTVTQSACELDHVGSSSQTACSSCRRSLTATARDAPGIRAAHESGEPRLPGGYRGLRAQPKLPPLVFEAQGSHREKPYVGVDVVCCRRNGLANAPFPLPILCPCGRRGARGAGAAAGLRLRDGRRDTRQAALQLLPFVGPGWYPKVSIAAMLETGVCRWDHIPLGINARGHVGVATLRWAMERMDAAWPEGEEHMAKLSNAMIGLWARRTDVIYSVHRQLPAGRPRRLHAKLLLRGGQRLGLRVHTAPANQRNVSPHPRRRAGLRALMVAKARRLLAAPPRYMK